MAVGYEDWVVSESVFTSWRIDQRARHLAFDYELGSIGVNVRGRAHKTRTAAIDWDLRNLGEDQLKVCPIIAVGSRPARGENSRHAVKGVNTKSGVISHRG